MDCIVSCIGGRGGLLVLTERSTPYTIIVKLKAISQKEVLKAYYSHAYCSWEKGSVENVN
jgi:IS30 family transposase